MAPFAAILAASLSSRIRYLGFARVPGVLIASSGGTLASGMLATSAPAQWVLSWPGTATNPSVVRPLADLAFATGGPGAVLLPIARFGGLAWLIAAAALLPASRQRSTTATATTTQEGITR
jgi:hypothetical protein